MQRLIASRKERLELTKYVATTAGGMRLDPGKDLPPLPGKWILARAPPVTYGRGVP
ncbi:hypothetical protein KSZ_21020 [Dictyobacter formicarum]|uniref:Uncharacterized protein n=1 Tax=Dictyobacter formicarum TaxID=2778368 RepID=A0ABQ3VEG0_9CHLR|nr:hypothetical protein KSZ_21020 [Dictyobacter formicarum]